MSNMSYCIFENTAADLAECVEHINDPIDELSSDYERRGRKNLIASAIELLEAIGYEISDEDVDEENK